MHMSLFYTRLEILQCHSKPLFCPTTFYPLGSPSRILEEQNRNKNKPTTRTPPLPTTTTKTPPKTSTRNMPTCPSNRLILFQPPSFEAFQHVGST